MKRWSEPSKMRRWSAVATIFLASMTASTASAGPPPVDFALEAVGDAAGDRADESWGMTKVVNRPVQFCRESGEADDAGGRRFASSGGDEIVVGPEAAVPWNLVWATLWASDPAGVFDDFKTDWAEEPATVEVFRDELVHCYGDDSRLCVDEASRRIAVLELRVDGVDYAFRAGAGGERLEVAVDGSPVARLVVGACG